jgi:hypothetical protein
MEQLTWDYSYPEHIGVFHSQKDWNQTLITRINQMSAMILKNTHRGGANKIKINSVLLPLFKDLEYFNVDNYNKMFLSGRYHITIDDSLPKNIVLLLRETQDILDAKENNLVFSFFTTQEENNVYETITLRLLKIDSDEYNQALNDPKCKLLTDENLSGKIEILNYE